MKKLIIAGDSAGGFLALNVTSSSIRNQVRKPDGVILTYPGIYLC